MDGLLLIDKPEGPTSHDIVAQMRRTLGTRKIGHAGTLDPPASGLLVLAVGTALKTLQFMEDHDKTYEFTLRFGRATDTDDATGKTIREEDPSTLTREQIEKALDAFRGPIQQVPPRYAAVKKEGVRLHEAARRGEELTVPPRPVVIHELTMTAWDPPCGSFTLACSKGTYVRSIGRDLGAALGPGAMVEKLRRIRSGPFGLSDARAPDASPDTLRQNMLPPDAGLAHLSLHVLDHDEAWKFVNGHRLPLSLPEGLLRIAFGKTLLGIGTSDGSILRAKRVFQRELATEGS